MSSKKRMRASFRRSRISSIDHFICVLDDFRDSPLDTLISKTYLSPCFKGFFNRLLPAPYTGGDDCLMSRGQFARLSFRSF